jgi:hypothetical protein
VALGELREPDRLTRGDLRLRYRPAAPAHAGPYARCRVVYPLWTATDGGQLRLLTELIHMDSVATERDGRNGGAR